MVVLYTCVYNDEPVKEIQLVIRGSQLRNEMGNEDGMGSDGMGSDEMTSICKSGAAGCVTAASA